MTKNNEYIAIKEDNFTEQYTFYIPKEIEHSICIDLINLYREIKELIETIDYTNHNINCMFTKPQSKVFKTIENLRTLNIKCLKDIKEYINLEEIEGEYINSGEIKTMSLLMKNTIKSNNEN